MFVSMPSTKCFARQEILLGLLLFFLRRLGAVQPTRPEACGGIHRQFGSRIEDPPNLVRRGERVAGKPPAGGTPPTALTMLVDYSEARATRRISGPSFANTFDRNSQKNFLNEYYDDEGWWALGWAGAYELTHDARYLEMVGDDLCRHGGGLGRHLRRRHLVEEAEAVQERHRQRAIPFRGREAGEPRPRTAQKKATYLDWAQREWKWFAASGMINADNLVNDGLDAACHNNHRTTWTYNQGVILGGLTVLSKLTGDPKPLEAAQSIALSAIARLTDLDGVLHDPCEPARCGNDAPKFKGVFVRNLAVLNAAAPVPGLPRLLPQECREHLEESRCRRPVRTGLVRTFRVEDRRDPDFRPGRPGGCRRGRGRARK